MTMTRRLAFAALVCLLFVPALSKSAELAPADTIVLNGKIYTVNTAQPMAEALAILNGKIIAVGSSKEIGRYRGPKTQVIDAGGRLVLPGFTDCHTHFLSGALSLGQVQVDGTTSVPEIQERVRKYIAAHPGKGWVLGRGWNYAVFGATALLNKKDLDAVVYTLGAAFAGRRERAEGSLETGKVADLIVLDQNLFEIDPHKISQTQVLLTLVGGKPVYRAPHWKAAAERRSEQAVR